MAFNSVKLDVGGSPRTSKAVMMLCKWHSGALGSCKGGAT